MFQWFKSGTSQKGIRSRAGLGMPKIPFSVFRTGRLTRVLFFGQILLEFRSATGLTKTPFFGAALRFY